MKYEYLHEFIWCRTASEKVVFKAAYNSDYYSLENRREVKSDYDEERINAALATRGNEGWEIVNMEPRWSWYVRSDDSPRGVGYAFPNHLTGYWVTFRRNA